MPINGGGSVAGGLPNVPIRMPNSADRKIANFTSVLTRSEDSPDTALIVFPAKEPVRKSRKLAVRRPRESDAKAGTQSLPLA